MALDQDTTFDIALSQHSLKHLLLGNGFSLAFDQNRFSFSNLFEVAAFDDVINKLVRHDTVEGEGIGTFPDFERTLRVLRDTEVVLKQLSISIPTDIKVLSDQLREGLIKAVHAIHQIVNEEGERSGCITSLTDHQVLSAAEFLKNFQATESVIFTLNYDLLLYCLIMKLRSSAADKSPTVLATKLANAGVDFKNVGDGFVRYQTPRCEWKVWSTPWPRVCYLHGALHLFEEGDSTYKEEASSSSLVDVIEQKVGAGDLPLFVSEGTTNRKLSAIARNAYLTDCLDRLRSIRGAIFVFGSSLDGRDKHIWSQIDKNDYITHVYVGYRGQNSRSAINQRITDKFPIKISNKLVTMFDVSNIDVWGNQ